MMEDKEGNLVLRSGMSKRKGEDPLKSLFKISKISKPWDKIKFVKVKASFKEHKSYLAQADLKSMKFPKEYVNSWTMDLILL